MNEYNRGSEFFNYLKKNNYSLNDAIWATKFIECLKSGNYSFDDLVSAVNSLQHTKQKDFVQTVKIKSRIARILSDLRVASDPEGYVYCLEAVWLVYENPHIEKSDIDVLYQTIANMHGVTRTIVLGNIKTVIDKVFDKTPEIVYQKYFGNLASRQRCSISHRDFIVFLANYLKAEDKITRWTPCK